MQHEVPTRQIEDIHELVELIELDDIFFFEERARRVDAPALADDAEPEQLTSNSLGVRHIDTGEFFGITYRFRIAFNDGIGSEFVSDVEARYSLPERCEIDESIQREFATRVAFMTVYPYIRSSIQTMAMRIGVPAPILGIVRQGGMTVDGAMHNDMVRAQFSDTKSEFSN